MFCEHCGTKIDKDTKFCHSCGKKVGTTSNTESNNIKSPEVSAPIVGIEDVFYSEDWCQKNGFTLLSRRWFDVMLDKQYLYLIDIPTNGMGGAGLLLGGVIGASIG